MEKAILKRTLFSFGALLLVASFVTGCKKKDRLSASTFTLTVTPPAVRLVKGQSQMFIAQGRSPGGNVNVIPSWSVSDTTLGTLDTFFGDRVVFTSAELGDVSLSASFDGVSTAVQIAIVTFNPGSNTFDVYIDAGLPSGNNVMSDIFASPSTISLEEISQGFAPEGEKLFRANNLTTGQSWGVTLDKNNEGRSVNLTSFVQSGGNLKFALKLGRILGTESIQILVRDSDNVADSVLSTNTTEFPGFSKTTTDWQELSIPLSTLTNGIDTNHVKVPFAIVMLSLSTPLTFEVDAVRWEK